MGQRGQNGSVLTQRGPPVPEAGWHPQPPDEVIPLQNLSPSSSHDDNSTPLACGDTHGISLRRLRGRAVIVS